jgi:hypothetical protein
MRRRRALTLGFRKAVAMRGWSVKRGVIGAILG